MPSKLPDIKIVVDSREKKPWVFEEEEKVAGKIRIAGSIVEGLDCGDYSIQGYEDIVRVERKNGFCELFGNMTPKANKERFEREMEKLALFPYKYIVIESNLSTDVLGLSVPQFYKAPPCSAVVRWLMQIQMEYGVPYIFAGDAGKRWTKGFFDTIVRKMVSDGTIRS